MTTVRTKNIFSMPVKPISPFEVISGARKRIEDRLKVTTEREKRGARKNADENALMAYHLHHRTSKTDGLCKKNNNNKHRSFIKNKKNNKVVVVVAAAKAPVQRNEIQDEEEQQKPLSTRQLSSKIKDSINDMVMELSFNTPLLSGIDQILSYECALASKHLKHDKLYLINKGLIWPLNLCELNHGGCNASFYENVVIEIFELLLRVIFKMEEYNTLGDEEEDDDENENENKEKDKQAKKKDPLLMMEGGDIYADLDTASCKKLFECAASVMSGMYYTSPCIEHEHCSHLTCIPASFVKGQTYRSKLTGAIMKATGFVYVCKWTCRIHICHPSLCRLAKMTSSNDGSTCPVSGNTTETPLMMSVCEQASNNQYQNILRFREHNIHDRYFTGFPSWSSSSVVGNSSSSFFDSKPAKKTYKTYRRSRNVKKGVVAHLNAESIDSSSNSNNDNNIHSMDFLGKESTKTRDEIVAYTHSAELGDQEAIREHERLMDIEMDIKQEVVASRVAKGDYSDLGVWAGMISDYPELAILSYLQGMADEEEAEAVTGINNGSLSSSSSSSSSFKAKDAKIKGMVKQAMLGSVNNNNGCINEDKKSQQQPQQQHPPPSVPSIIKEIMDPRGHMVQMERDEKWGTASGLSLHQKIVECVADSMKKVCHEEAFLSSLISFANVVIDSVTNNLHSHLKKNNRNNNNNNNQRRTTTAAVAVAATRPLFHEPISALYTMNARIKRDYFLYLVLSQRSSATTIPKTVSQCLSVMACKGTLAIVADASVRLVMAIMYSQVNRAANKITTESELLIVCPQVIVLVNKLMAYLVNPLAFGPLLFGTTPITSAIVSAEISQIHDLASWMDASYGSRNEFLGPACRFNLLASKNSSAIIKRAHKVLAVVDSSHPLDFCLAQH